LKENKMSILKKGLYIVSTPIGNLDDISFRAIKILKEADLIICENPKHSLKLLNKFDIKKKLLSLHDYNEEKIIKKIEKYNKTAIIALISDAGSPLISDPGFKLVKSFIDNDIYITIVPGASSVISSLQLSGFATNNFVFFGFVPKKNKEIQKLIDNINKTNLTTVLFISGNRIVNFLQLVLQVQTNIEIAICKELTKINEAVIRGGIKSVVKEFVEKKINLKGEFTLVLSSSEEKARIIDDTVKNLTLQLLKKYSLTEVVKIVHKLSNISKKEIYQMALKLTND